MDSIPVHVVQKFIEIILRILLLYRKKNILEMSKNIISYFWIHQTIYPVRNCLKWAQFRCEVEYCILWQDLMDVSQAPEAIVDE